VYAASHRLDLRLLFTGERSVRELLETWPALPIFVPLCGLSDEIDGEARAALDDRDRVCEIYVDVASDNELELLAEATRQGSFPALRDLHIGGVPRRWRNTGRS
jgi:hypothetical protein